MKLLQRLKNLFLPEGQISDGFHTFDELYHYTMQHSLTAWKVNMRSINLTDMQMANYALEEDGLLLWLTFLLVK